MIRLITLCDNVVGEVVGFHTTLKWMADLHYDNVDFALDSKVVVDHFKSSVEDDSEFGCTMYACKQLFENSFQNWSHVEFNRRQVNEISHALVSVAPSNASSHVYDVAPSCISFLIANEKQWISTLKITLNNDDIFFSFCKQLHQEKYYVIHCGFFNFSK
jgi:hypothetical protein